MTGNSSAPRCRLLLKLVPGSSADGIQGWLGDALKVRVTAVPERGKANAALLEVLARALGLPRPAVRIISGHGSPRKVVEIEGMSETEVRRLLGSERPPG